MRKRTKGRKIISATMMHLSDNIKLIRLIADMTQPDFGEKFQATKPMIVSYESGKAKPDILFLSRLAEFASVTVDDLLNKKLEEKHIKVKKVEKSDKAEKDLGDSPKILQEVLAKLDLNHRLLLQLLSLETGRSVEDLRNVDPDKPLKVVRTYKKSSRS